MDLAIYVDMSRNPGPSGPSEDFVCWKNQPSFSNLTGTRFHAFSANQKLNYSRKNTLILQYYKSLPFVFSNIFSNNVVLNIPIRSSYIPVRITNRMRMRMGVCNYRHVKVRNLVKINISLEVASDKNRNVKKLHLSVLNARSINNNHY